MRQHLNKFNVFNQFSLNFSELLLLAYCCSARFSLVNCYVFCWINFTLTQYISTSFFFAKKKKMYVLTDVQVGQCFLLYTPPPKICTVTLPTYNFFITSNLIHTPGLLSCLYSHRCYYFMLLPVCQLCPSCFSYVFFLLSHCFSNKNK